MFLFDLIYLFYLFWDLKLKTDYKLFFWVQYMHDKVFQFINILTNILVRYLIHPSINSYALKLFLSSSYWLDAKFSGNELTEWNWDNNRNS